MGNYTTGYSPLVLSTTLLQ